MPPNTALHHKTPCILKISCRFLWFHQLSKNLVDLYPSSVMKQVAKAWHKWFEWQHVRRTLCPDLQVWLTSVILSGSAVSLVVSQIFTWKQFSLCTVIYIQMEAMHQLWVTHDWLKKWAFLHLSCEKTTVAGSFCSHQRMSCFWNASGQLSLTLAIKGCYILTNVLQPRSAAG